MVRLQGKHAHYILYGIFFLFAFWVAFALVYGKGGMLERRKMTTRLDRLQEEVRDLEEQSAYLDWQVENMKKNRRTIEAYARELGFKKEGELIFRFMKKKPSGGER
jgi:cell division protein FtsB